MASNVSVLGVPGLNQVDSNATQYRYNGEVPPEIAIKEQALNRRQQLANLLLQRATQAPQGQMAGRFYVGPSWAQGLAQLGQGLAGYAATKVNDQARADLNTESKNLTANAVQEYIQKMQGTPTEVPVQGPGAPTMTETGEGVMAGINQGNIPGESPAGMEFSQRQEPMYTEGPKPTASVTQPPSPDDKRKALIEAMTSQIPGLREFATLQAKQEDAATERATQREFLSQEKALDRENRLSVAEGQLNQAMMMGLISKDQKDQMLALQKQAETDRASHNKAIEGIQKGQLDLERQKIGQGKTPPGYRQTQEGNLEAIPGGPADTKLQGVLNQDTSMLENSSASMDRLASTANQLLNHPGLPGIVGVRGKIPDVPGTDAANARALLNTLKSQIGFGVLQEMRNNSKTGGALGSVSDAEGKRLENNLAALDTAQDIEQFKAQLKDGIIGYTDSAKSRLRDAYNMKHKGGEPIPMTGKGPAVGTVEDGYRFKGGDPKKAESWEKVQ